MHCPSDGSRQGFEQYCDGLQTPKLEHPEVILTTPLQYWFNKGLEHAFLSASIPFGQRYINMTINPLSHLADKAARFKKITIVRKH
jgi:hypothetical protein